MRGHLVSSQIAVPGTVRGVGTRKKPSKKRSRRPSTDRARAGRPKDTILVVDDDHANLALARTLLEAEGFGVRVATDAITAFDVLKTCDPSLILMDIQLPGMDGWELTHRLKHNPVTSHIPVVALTAYGTAGDETRARAAGCVAFVAKPVSTRELPTIVRRHLPKSRG